jgi:hypothetical protein
MWENLKRHDHKILWLLKESLWGDGVVNMTAFEITVGDVITTKRFTNNCKA